VSPGTASGREQPPAWRGRSAQQRDQSSVVISGVTIIDGTDAPPMPNMTVVIESERIAAVGGADEVEHPTGAYVVNGEGRFLIPGLWDAHVHAFVFPWQPDVYFPLLIANGVTGVRDMGGAVPMTGIDEVRAAIASGQRLGPRIVAGTMVDGLTPVWPFALRAGTEEEGRQMVVTVADSGADFVKVYTLLPADAFHGIAETANEWDIPFAGHVPIFVTPTEASAAGQRTIEHYSDSLFPFVTAAEDEVLAELRAAGSGPDPVQAYGAAFFSNLPRMLDTYDQGKAEALAEHLAENQTWFTPTLMIGQSVVLAGDPALQDDPRRRYLPADAIAFWDQGEPVGPELAAIARRSVEVGQAIIETMQQAGVPLMAGTDLGLPNIFPGFSLHDELTLLVDGGLTPLQALQAATRDAAAGVGLGEVLGTVEAGKLADLVLLDADPLLDIANTTRIAAVVANARLLEQSELEGILRTAEQQAATPMATPIP
jgi:imidazolonepropionase-like amidohydrolase